MSVTATFFQRLAVVETLALGLDLAIGTTNVTHTLNTANDAREKVLSATSSPPATKTYSQRITLSAGAHNIDLTSLPGPNSTIVDFTGLRIQLMHIRAAASNSAPVTVAGGATDPYELYGDANGQRTLKAGTQELAAFPDGPDTQDVDATHKVISLSSSDLDATVDVILVAG